MSSCPSSLGVYHLKQLTLWPAEPANKVLHGIAVELLNRDTRLVFLTVDDFACETLVAR